MQDLSVTEQQTVDAVLDAAGVDLDDAMVMRLCYDLAQRIHDNDTIARRYGLHTEDGLRRYLRAQPQIALRAKKLRALLEGDMGSEERARLKALYASEELVAPIAQIAANTANNAAVRIDAFKQLNRMGGVDGVAATRDSHGAPALGGQFTVNFNFTSGRQQLVIDANPELLGAPPS